MARSSTLPLGSLALLFASAVSAQNTLVSVAGGGGLAGGPALSAVIPEIGSIASDGAGNGYGVSRVTCVVYKYDSSGNITVFAGNGVCVSSGDGGPATQASFNGPISVAVDAHSNVYVADLPASVVRKISSATGIITTVAGNGTFGFSGDGGPATQASLSRPDGVAVDALGNLYIADMSNHAIRRVDALTGIITTIAGLPPQGGYSGDGGLATAALIGQPAALVFDAAGNLFFAQLASCTVRRIDALTGIITRYAGNLSCGYAGDGGPALNAVLQFTKQNYNRPQLAFDSSGNLLITDQVNHRIRRVTASTGVISTIAGTGTAGFSGDGGPAASANLNFPSGILVDNQGVIFVADTSNSRVRKIDTSAQQIITTFAGSGSLGDGGPANSAVLSPFNGLARDSQGNLFIGDSVSDLIREVSTSGTISTVAGIPFYGEAPIGDGGPATKASLSFPSGLAFDSHGNLFVADTNNSSVREISTAGIITTYAGNLTGGNSGDGGLATQAQLSNPYGLGFDAADNLYIADGDNNNVRRVDAITHIITTVAGNGTAGFSGDNGPATSATLNLPSNVKVDSQGNLLIADFFNSRIRRVDHVTGVITTFAGNGSTTLSGDGGAAALAGIGFVWGLGFDSAGNLFFSDDFNQAIRRIDASTGTISTIAGNHGCASSGIGGPALQAAFCEPADLFVDPSENIFFADSATRRVYEIGLGPVSSVVGNFTDFGLVSVGTTSVAQTVSLKNTGSTTLTITNLTATGNFATALTCPSATVAPLQACGVQAFFTPGVVGPQVGTLSFSTNDASHPSYSFNLSGTGFTGPTLGVGTAALAFGNEIVSTTSPAQAVTIANTGGANVIISSIAISGANPKDFAQTNNCPLAPAALTPGTGCGIFVTFSPLALGARSAALVITDSQGNIANAQQNVSLTGTGTDVPVAASTTYNINGHPFTTFTGAAACPPDCNIAGSFTQAQPLPPNLSNATITPTSFSFTVGTTNLNQGNVTSASFNGISTDASGYITSWGISLANANFSIVTNNTPGNVADTFTIVVPQGSASNANSPATWPKTVVTPLTFNASAMPVSNIATVNCPSGTVPCTDANAHSLKLTVPAVSSGFTLTVTSVEVPISEANGLCEAGHTEANDFDCRFVGYFTIQSNPNGDVVVPQCIPYSNGNCVYYRVSNTPPEASYTPGVLEYIAWNNTSYAPPRFYDPNNPRLFDDPDDPPYDVNHQFVFDITTYYKPTGNFVGVDNGIGGGTKHFNDFVVAYPAAPSYAYTMSFVPPLSSTRKAHFEQGDSIFVRFTLSPNTPAGIATQTPNHVGYSVLLDTNTTGCSDFSGTIEPTLTPANSPADFTYNPIRQLYDLKLRGIYPAGQYKILLNSNLAPQKCAVFVVTKDN
jgi:sugar lactone lactonase YvrE